jgi:hypothetical protein
MHLPEFLAELSLERIISAFGGAAAGVALMPNKSKDGLTVTWASRAAQFASGGLLAYFGADDVANWFNMKQGLAGFMTGALGMAVVAKLLELIQRFDLLTMATDWAKARLGIPTKKDE